MTERFNNLPTNVMLAIVAGVPSLVVFLYFAFAAPQVYQSEAKVIVRLSRDATAAMTGGVAASLLGLGTTDAMEDSRILVAYLQSPEFIELAEQRLQLREHYATPKFAIAHRLEQHASQEDFWQFVRSMLEVRIEEPSGLVVIRAKAYTPEKAEALGKLTLEQSELAINRLNERMVNSQTKLAQQTLDQAQRDLIARRQQLLKFQADNAVVNPSSELGTHVSGLASLDSRLLQKRAELRAKSQYLREDAFEIRAINQEIRALEEQRQKETETLISSSDKNLSRILQDYEDIKMQAEFAVQTYSSAFALVEKAKMEASRQEKFLLTVAAPFLPEEPVAPRPLRNAVTTFVVISILFAISRLVGATVKDHSI